MKNNVWDLDFMNPTECVDYSGRDNFWNMEWSKDSIGYGICNLECMTLDCDYDIAQGVL